MDHQVANRRRHALLELRERGVLKSGKYPPGLRLILWLFPRQKAPYYGDYGLYGVQMGVLFALPFVGLLSWVISLEGTLHWSLGAGLGFGAGALFGYVMSAWMKSVHRKLMLTPWDQLDEPSGAAPKDAERYKDLEREMLRNASLVSMIKYVNRD